MPSSFKEPFRAPSYYKEAFRPPSYYKVQLAAPSSFGQKEPAYAGSAGSFWARKKPAQAGSAGFLWPEEAGFGRKSRLTPAESRLWPKEPAYTGFAGFGWKKPAYAGSAGSLPWPKEAGLHRLSRLLSGRAGSFKGAACCSVPFKGQLAVPSCCKEAACCLRPAESLEDGRGAAAALPLLWEAIEGEFQRCPSFAGTPLRETTSKLSRPPCKGEPRERREEERGQDAACRILPTRAGKRGRRLRRKLS